MKHVNKKFGLKWTKVPTYVNGVCKISHIDFLQEELQGRFYNPYKRFSLLDNRFAYVENPESAAYLMMKYM